MFPEWLRVRMGSFLWSTGLWRKGAKDESPALSTTAPGLLVWLWYKPGICSDCFSGKNILLINALLLHVQRGCGAVGWRGRGGGVRRVRGSTGPATGIGSPQHEHVRAVRSPRPSFCSSTCSLLAIPVKFPIYNRFKSLDLCTFLPFFQTVLSPNGGCSLIPFPCRVCLRFCSHYCLDREFPSDLESRLSFPTPFLLFLILVPEPASVSYLKGTLPRLPGA